MVILSRTPEGDAFSCRVCGAVDRVEPCPLTGDSVCPRCGEYVALTLASFDALLHGTEPLGLDAALESFPDYDSLDLVGHIEELAGRLGKRPNWSEFERCRTVGDLVRFLVSLNDPR